MLTDDESYTVMPDLEQIRTENNEGIIIFM